MTVRARCRRWRPLGHQLCRASFRSVPLRDRCDTPRLMLAVIRILPVIAVAALLVAAIGCAGDDDAPSVADSIHTAIVPDQPATATPDQGPGAEHVAKARELCPAAFSDACTEVYVGAALSDLPSALCVSSMGTWFMEAPGGQPGEAKPGVVVGDKCSGDPTHRVVTLLNYP